MSGKGRAERIFKAGNYSVYHNDGQMTLFGKTYATLQHKE